MKTPFYTKKPFIITAVAVICLIAGIFVWRTVTTRPAPASPTVSTKQFSGPTTQEKTDSAAHKDELAQQQTGQSRTAQGQKEVIPIIDTARQSGDTIRVTGYVSGIFEDGGSCTFSIMQSDTKVVKTTQGFGNVSTTQCTPLIINRSEFKQAGQWQVTLEYRSPAAKGTSQTKTLEVQ